VTQSIALSPANVDRLAKRLVAHHPYPGAAHAILETLVAQGQLLKIADGETLCNEGDPGEVFWFLLRGEIKVQRTDPNGKIRELTTITTPALLGHMAVIDRSRRSAACIASGDTELVAINLQTYERLLVETSPAGTALRRLLLSSLCGQLAGANARMQELANTMTAAVEEANTNSKATAGRSSREPSRDTAEHEVVRITAKLGGWAADLEDLAETEKEISYVVDEDQKRRNEKRTLK